MSALGQNLTLGRAASRSRGPKDDFSTDQTLKDLRSDKCGSHRSKALMLNGRLSNRSKRRKKMKMLPQVLFWLGLISVPLAWLVWYFGSEIEMVKIGRASCRERV